jgi:hypothetical protein
MKKSWLILVALILLVVVGSFAAWELSRNDTRRAGALGGLSEPLPLAWRGGWSAEQRYAAGEVVSYQGLAYVAERETDSNPPAPAECGQDCAWTAMGGKVDQDPGGTGAPGLTWKGPYTITRAYKQDDIVQESGSAWIALGDVPSCSAEGDNLAAGTLACYLANAPGQGQGGSQQWALLASKGAKGDLGEQGPKGDPGPQGPKGDAALGEREVVSATPGPKTCTAKNLVGGCTSWYEPPAKANCPPGKVATGGGAYMTLQSSPNTSITVKSVPEDNGWVALTSPSQAVTVYVVCIGG